MKIAIGDTIGEVYYRHATRCTTGASEIGITVVNNTHRKPRPRQWYHLIPVPARFPRIKNSVERYVTFLWETLIQTVIFFKTENLSLSIRMFEKDVNLKFWNWWRSDLDGEPKDWRYLKVFDQQYRDPLDDDVGRSGVEADGSSVCFGGRLLVRGSCYLQPYWGRSRNRTTPSARGIPQKLHRYPSNSLPFVQVVIFPFLFHNISFELMQLLKHFPIGISSWNSSTNVIAEVNLFPLRIDIFVNNTTNGCFLVTICLECMLF